MYIYITVVVTTYETYYDNPYILFTFLFSVEVRLGYNL
jgi:hypothetical protein